MANRWFIRAITFKWNASSQAYVVDDTYQFGDVVSAKLTLRRGDTSTLKVVTTPSSADNPEPVKSLVEVLFGATVQSAERKFFGTITKRTYTQPEGLYSYEAVGVLGSYKFLPNYDGYANSATIGDVITTERKRFRGEYAQTAPQYTPSAWELIYTGQARVPSNFGMLYDNYISGALTCNLDSLQKNSKNAYEFIKAVTKEGAYLRGTNQSTWGAWVEEGETATFTAISTFNDQQVTYDENLISLTFEDNPFYTHIDAVNKGSEQGVSHNNYPNPFYYARIRAKDKATGNEYTSTELQNFANAEMTRNGRVAEAICFDRHVYDDSIPWFDMRKKVSLRYKLMTGYTTSIEMEILEISYDLCNSANDRIKLGASQTPLTDYTENAESIQSSGGTMTGDLNFKDSSSVVSDSKQTVRGRIFGTCNIFSSSLEQGGINTTTGQDESLTMRLRSGYVAVDASTAYTLSFVSTYARVRAIFEYNASRALVRANNYGTNYTKQTLTTQSSTAFVRILLQRTDSGTMSPSEVSNLQLENGSSASPYVPHAMDNVELTKLVSPTTDTYYHSTQVARTTSLDDSGTYLNLERGWYTIMAEAVANNASIHSIALVNVYSETSYELLDYKQSQSISGLAQARLGATWSGYLDFESTTVKVYVRYNGTTSNQVLIRAKKLV